MYAQKQWEYVRTPDARFTNLSGYDFKPNYKIINGLRMHYVDEGHPDSSVVVMLHGEPSWSYLYRDMIKCMVASGYRVIAPDLIGFGKSDKLTKLTDYTYERQVAWTKTLLLDSLKLSNINLFVQDWGGLIGLRILAENQQFFRKIAAGNTALPTGDSIFVVGENFSQWQNFAANSPNFDIGQFVARGTVTGLTTAEIAAYNAPFPSEEYKKGARQMPQLVPTKATDPATPANKKAWEVLSKLQLPFLTLFSDENTVGQEFEKIFQDIIPGAKGQPHKLLKGGGHFYQEDNTAELCEILKVYFRGGIINNPVDTTSNTCLNAAKAFPPMPKGAGDLISFNPGQGLPTFGSGTPFNDLEFTLYDSDYIDGENGGSDVFLPVDPSDDYPGSNKVKIIKTVLNSDLDFNYRNNAKRDRIILGTAESGNPYFLKGADRIDNDYLSLLHFDYRFGRVQLPGAPAHYQLLYASKDQGVKTTGNYLFYTKGGGCDLIAFIFPCDSLVPAISGNPPQNKRALCNEDGILSLTNPNQFIFAKPLIKTPAIQKGIGQFGSNGKEIVGGMTTDSKGFIYAVGLTDGNLDNKTDAENEIFITKMDSLGKTLWTTELAMKEGTFLKDAICDDEFIYAAGRTLGNLPGFTNAGRWDGILLKLRLDNGSIVAMNQWGNQAIDGYGSVILDDNGNLFVSAQGSPAGQSTTDDSYLVAKHKKSDLSNVWRVIEPTVATGFSASAEAWGGLTYVKGNTPGNGRLISAGWYIAQAGANAFISIYENLNDIKPSRPHSIVLNSPQGATADWILDNVADSKGNLYFAGFTTGNFQGNNLGEGDAYIVKYSPTLTNPVFKQVGTVKSDQFYKLDIDENDVLYATGYTYGDFAGKNADPTNESGDVIVVKFDSNLNEIGKVQFGTPYEDRANARLLGNKLYIAGMTEGSMCGTSKGSFDGYALALHTKDLSFVDFRLPTAKKEELAFAREIKIYPNPAYQTLFVETSRQDINFTIVNQQGMVLMKGNLIQEGSIDISKLNNGMHFILFEEDGVYTSKKFIKID
jgi:pimeloyl-ACP methyl ester carboxylesterase